MATYVLIQGAGSDAWYWHRVVPLLAARGHDTVTVDLPCRDESAGLAEYADVVVEAVGDREHVIVVAQSLGGFVAPLVAERRPVELLVLVNAMVPSPGETDWWTATCHPVEMGPDVGEFRFEPLCYCSLGWRWLANGIDVWCRCLAYDAFGMSARPRRCWTRFEGGIGHELKRRRGDFSFA